MEGTLTTTPRKRKRTAKDDSDIIAAGGVGEGGGTLLDLTPRNPPRVLLQFPAATTTTSTAAPLATSLTAAPAVKPPPAPQQHMKTETAAAQWWVQWVQHIPPHLRQQFMLQQQQSGAGPNQGQEQQQQGQQQNLFPLLYDFVVGGKPDDGDNDGEDEEEEEAAEQDEEQAAEQDEEQDEVSISMQVSINSVATSSHSSSSSTTAPGSGSGSGSNNDHNNQQQHSYPSLVLRRVETRSDHARRFRASVLALENEIKSRLDDYNLALAQKQAAEEAMVEDGDDDRERITDVEEMLHVMNRHRTVIKKLRAQVALESNYSKTTSTSSWLLEPYQATTLACFPGRVLMWCPTAQHLAAAIPAAPPTTTIVELTRSLPPVEQVVLHLQKPYPHTLNGMEEAKKGACGEVWDMQVSRHVIFLADVVGKRLHIVNRKSGELLTTMDVIGARGVALVETRAFVADTLARCVRIFDFSDPADCFNVRTLSPKPAGVNAFAPLGIAADANHVFVTDPLNKAVQMLNHFGDFIATFKVSRQPQQQQHEHVALGSDGRFESPERLAIGDGVLAVSCAHSMHINLLSVASVDAPGTFLRSFRYLALDAADSEDAAASIAAGKKYPNSCVLRLAICNGLIYLLIALGRHFSGYDRRRYAAELLPHLELQVFTLAKGEFVRRCNVKHDFRMPAAALVEMSSPGGQKGGEGVSVLSLVALPTSISSAYLAAAAATTSSVEKQVEEVVVPL